jgi:hypothetical protein
MLTFLLIGTIGFIPLAIILEVIASYKFKKPFINKILSFFNHTTLYLILFGICLASLITITPIATYESSPENYIRTLQIKEVIEMELDTYKADINFYLSGNIEMIDFNKQNNLIDLNRKIENYNNKVLKHRNYKDSFWLKDFYNADIARLNTFKIIFNKQ